MNFGTFFDRSVQKGIDVDVQGRSAIEARLEHLRQAYENLSEQDKQTFDVERLRNPFGDTRILYGDRTYLWGRSISAKRLGGVPLRLSSR